MAGCGISIKTGCEQRPMRDVLLAEELTISDSIGIAAEL